MAFIGNNEKYNKQILALQASLIDLHDKKQSIENSSVVLKASKMHYKSELNQCICDETKALAVDGLKAIQVLMRWKPNNKLGNLPSLFENMNKPDPYCGIKKCEDDIAKKLVQLKTIERSNVLSLNDVQHEIDSKTIELEQTVINKLNGIKDEVDWTNVWHSKMYDHNSP